MVEGLLSELHGAVWRDLCCWGLFTSPHALDRVAKVLDSVGDRIEGRAWVSLEPEFCLSALSAAKTVARYGVGVCRMFDVLRWVERMHETPPPDLPDPFPVELRLLIGSYLAPRPFGQQSDRNRHEVLNLIVRKPAHESYHGAKKRIAAAQRFVDHIARKPVCRSILRKYDRESNSALARKVTLPT